MGRMIDSDRKALKHLFIFDQLRGEDSTGLGLIEKNKSIWCAKEVGTPNFLFNNWDCFDEKGLVKDGWKYKSLIGHNRAATKGSVTNENAHPFTHGNVIGAHNGTLTSVSKLEDGNKFEVDSEAIFYNLSKHPIKDVIGNIQGAYALTWYDQRTDKMYFIRNSQRPLFFARREDKDVIFWASEAWMLNAALGRCSVKHTEVKELPVNHLLSFDLSDGSIRERELVDEGEMLGYIPPVTTYHHRQTHHYPPRYTPRNNSSVKKDDETSIPKKELEKMLGKEVEFYVEGEDKTGNLNYLCARPITMEDYEIRIFGDNHPSYQEWKTKNTTFKGKVKRVQSFRLKHRGKVETYVLLDLRTIEEVFYEKDEKKEGNVIHLADRIPFNKPLTGFKGATLTEAEFRNATCKGCAWCSASAGHDDALLWLSKDEFLCPDCKDNPEIWQYANNLVSIH